MKKLFSFFVFTLSCSILFSQEKEQREPYLVKNINQSFSAAEVRTSGGNITVSVGSPVRVEVFISGNNSKETLSKEEMKQRMEELYDLEIAVAGNKLIAYARSKEPIRDWKKALNVSFQLTVPEKLSTELYTSGGNITITEINGEQHLETSGGNLKVHHLSGKIFGRTSGGDIYLSNVKEYADLTTSGGNIIAAHSSGTLKLNTSGGDVLLKALEGNIEAGTSGGNVEGGNISGDLRARTSGGNVRLNGLSCKLDASTSSGFIRVGIDKLTDKIRLNNSGGNIELTLPKGVPADLDIVGSLKQGKSIDNFTGKITENSVRGKLNGGGIAVVLDAVRIDLDFK